MAAINPTISGVYWLKLNVENKIVWFKILWRNENEINCIVSEEKKILFGNNLNVELVSRGLASVRPYDQSCNRIDSYNKLYKNLIKSETKAKKNNCGLWFEPTKWHLFNNKMQIYLQSIKRMKL